MKLNHRRLILPSIFVLLLLAAVIAPEAMAQKSGNFGLDTAAGSTIPKTKDIGAIIGRLLKAALGFVGTLFLLLMVYAGFTYMTARGDSKKVDTAKQLITGAIIGLVIIASAYAITTFVLQAATGTLKETPAPTETTPSNNNCQPSKCVNNSDCSDTACYTGVCRCLDNGAPPCNRAGGQDGQCTMK